MLGIMQSMKCRLKSREKVSPVQTMNNKQILVFVTLVASTVIQVSSSVVKSLYTNGPEYSHYIYLDHSNLASGDTLRFSVRTARDAHILLATSLKADQQFFEIVLGARNNTFNLIRDSKYSAFREPKAVVRTVNLLSRQEFRNFWIKIKDEYEEKYSNVLEVGIGKEDTPFLTWRYRYYSFPRYISFRSDGWAEWRYGYIDETYTEALYTDGRGAGIKMSRSRREYGQYLPLSEVVSHSALAVRLHFQLWSKDQFRVLLSPKVGWSDHVLEFGVEMDSIHITQYQGGVPRYTSANMKDALGTEEFVQYWIKLTKAGQIIMGQGNSSRPILRMLDPHLRSPQFVSFGLSRGFNEKFDPRSFASVWYGMGAADEFTSITQDCRPRWKEAKNRQLPPGAVRGGYNDRDELFVCRAKHYRHVLPGSFVPDDEEMGTCRVSFDIDVIQKTSFEVLTGCQFAWIPASLGHIPAQAIPAGKNSIGEIVYAIRATHEGQVIIGKLHSGHRIAYIAFDNREVLPFTNYEVLVRGQDNFSN